MESRNVYDFIGREKVEAYTENTKNSFFSINLKKYKVKPNAYTLRNNYFGGNYMKSWNFEGSNDGKTWQILSQHKDNKSLEGEYQSKTWQVVNVNEYYSFFRIIMTGTDGNGDHYLCCSGMECYGVLAIVNPVSISLQSDASIINYGQINAVSGISFECNAFENYESIESTKGEVAIKCKSFKNESIIHPKPIIHQ